MYDGVPVVSGLVTTGVLAQVGPTKEEWSGVVMAVLALVVRELVWWLRNRKQPSSESTTVDGG